MPTMPIPMLLKAACFPCLSTPRTLVLVLSSILNNNGALCNARFGFFL